MNNIAFQTRKYSLDAIMFWHSSLITWFIWFHDFAAFHLICHLHVIIFFSICDPSISLLNCQAKNLLVLNELSLSKLSHAKDTLGGENVPLHRQQLSSLCLSLGIMKLSFSHLYMQELVQIIPSDIWLISESQLPLLTDKKVELDIVPIPLESSISGIITSLWKHF